MTEGISKQPAPINQVPLDVVTMTAAPAKTTASAKTAAGTHAPSKSEVTTEIVTESNKHLDNLKMVGRGTVKVAAIIGLAAAVVAFHPLMLIGLCGSQFLPTSLMPDKHGQNVKAFQENGMAMYASTASAIGSAILSWGSDKKTGETAAKVEKSDHNRKGEPEVTVEHVHGPNTGVPNVTVEHDKKEKKNEDDRSIEMTAIPKPLYESAAARQAREAEEQRMRDEG